MKKVLIISPTFPPINSADMQRVRLSLPYFKKFGWLPVVMTVDEKYIESYSIDPLLLKSIPGNTRIIKVRALDAKATRKFGIGSLSLRSLFPYYAAIKNLLKKEKFDLVYFSTTAFHVLTLGPVIKKKFKIPFIVDIQDPWRNDYYLSKPVNERPPKFLIAHKINSTLERYTIPKSGGVISVSTGYVKMLMKRYPKMKKDQFRTIPFGASQNDFEISKTYVHDYSIEGFNSYKKNIVYIGRGGFDMHFSITAFLKSFSGLLVNRSQIGEDVHIWFIGTSYSPSKKVPLKIKEIAASLSMEKYVTEISSRISFYESLSILKKADILLAIGSEDKNYTASKICQYVLAERPLLSIFHKDSDVTKILTSVKAGELCSFDDNYSEDNLINSIYYSLNKMLNPDYKYIKHDEKALNNYLDESMTKQQANFFDTIIYS